MSFNKCFLSFLVVLAIGCDPIDAVYQEPDTEEATESDVGATPDVNSEPDGNDTFESGATAPPHQCIDADGDYFCADGDCDDSPNDTDHDGIMDGALVHPGAVESCNGLDDNCNGQIDEGFEIFESYLDLDNDGYGVFNPNVDFWLCAGFPSFALQSGDCDDENPNIHPGAKDKPGNGIDADCDDETDQVESEQVDVEGGTKTGALITVTVAESNVLKLSYQLVAKEEDLGEWWEDETAEQLWNNIVHGSIVLTDSVAFVRVNVTVGAGVNETWLCVGNGETAALLEGAYVALTQATGGTFTIGEWFLWSEPSGEGCSVVFPVSLNI